MAGGRLGWYLNRLRSMGPAEIAHRVDEQRKRATGRHLAPEKLARQARNQDRLPLLPGFLERVRDLAEASAIDDHWRQHYRAVAAGELTLLGQAWPQFGAVPDWHLDPVSGEAWPAEPYCFAIPYRHERRRGDVKYVWEINRLQYLQPIAAHAAIAGDAAAAELVRAHLKSWLDANPPFHGINWCSGIELASRIVSLTVIASLLGPEGIGAGLGRRLIDSLNIHGTWIARFPSRFSSANNHLIAELGALFLLGTLMPDLDRAGTWRTRGRSLLEHEILLQIHGDGIGAEQSPTYTAYSLEWLMLAERIADAAGEPFSGAFLGRLEAAGEALRSFTDAGGNLPRIGDDDEGRVLADGGEEPGYVNTVLAAFGARFGRGDLVPPAAPHSLRRALYDPAPEPAAPATGLRQFPEGGYTVVRDGPPDAESLLVFDHAPLGYLAIAAHGHADALAVWLHLQGRPVLVDAGTYLYHSGGGWRDRFRGTPAHNTLALDGASSSVISGAFNWSDKAECRLLETRNDGQSWAVEAEHDGFLGRFGCRHHRRIEGRLSDGFFTIFDQLLGSGRWPVQIGFLVAPDLTIQGDGKVWRVRDGDRDVLRLSHDGPLVGQVETGGDAGWYSAAFGHREPAPRLVFAGEMSAGEPVSFRLDHA